MMGGAGLGVVGSAENRASLAAIELGTGLSLAIVYIIEEHFVSLENKATNPVNLVIFETKLPLIITCSRGECDLKLGSVVGNSCQCARNIFIGHALPGLSS